LGEGLFPGINQRNYFTNGQRGAGYRYDYDSGNYINGIGEVVGFGEVFNNYLAPNAANYYGDNAKAVYGLITSTRTLGISIDNKNWLHIYQQKLNTSSWTASLNGGITPSSQGDNLKLNSANSFIYDGQRNSEPLEQRLQAGQHVRVVVKNMNILGVQLDLQDKSRYTYEKTWLGTNRQVYTGDSYSFVLLPGQTKSFDFYRFDYVPIGWVFELGTTISDAANVQVRFYSDWVPGMPYDLNHPSKKW